jgi:Zn-dependent M16 (insulinase) family peptidase
MAMLLALLLAGCADAMPDGSRLKSIRELVRSYDNTLTSSEKKAAIAELQKDKERQQQELSEAKGVPNTK